MNWHVHLSSEDKFEERTQVNLILSVVKKQLFDLNFIIIPHWFDLFENEEICKVLLVLVI